MRLKAVILLMLSSVPAVYSQDMAPDTILSLEGITIYSDRINRFARGQALEHPDSLTRLQYPAGSLSELLNGFTSAYVRNYGQGTLTTLSVRGTSSNHTGLLWNGVRISPPNIGYVDLSLVQGNFFQEITLLHGGGSSMFGSGSIGGGLHLNNRPLFQNTPGNIELGLSAGSFGTYALEGSARVHSDKIYSHTAVSFLNAQNDFSYTNLTGVKERLQHGEIFKAGILQDLAVRLGHGQYIMGSLWFQAAGREIPPTLTESLSEAVQTDRAWRSMLIWKDFNNRNVLEAKLAYFNEYTLYDDPLSGVYSNIHSQSAVAAFESTWEITGNSTMFAGTQYTYEYADLDFYERPEDQQNLALYASFRQNIPALKWQFSFSSRLEFLTSYPSPLLFSAGLDGKIWKVINGRVNVSMNFRAPTLNERFWQPGGNPSLDPEKSWNFEGGLFVDEELNETRIQGSVTGFYSLVDNWILWLPGNSFWSVENAQRVRSRGVEVTGNQTFRNGKFNFHLVESYTLSRATNEKKLFDMDASYQKQLIYTPVHRMLLKAGTEFKGITFMLQGNLTGKVFTTKDNSTTLPSFFLLDALISKSIHIKKQYPVSVQLNLNNILNKDYHAVPYRPMPGFGFLVTVRGGISRKS